MTSYALKSKTSPGEVRDAEFENEAALLLAEFGEAHFQVASPPVPLGEIAEYLGLDIEYRDLRVDYPEGDVHGAIWFRERVIAIDQCLAPEDYPVMLGRFRFTLAHELGHWRLHRHLYARHMYEKLLWSDAPAGPDHVLRSTVRDTQEVQANRFAACLLMPRPLVKQEWQKQYGSSDPFFLADLKRDHDSGATDEAVLEHAARPLAKIFQVSAIAMRIRLEGMGFLVRKKENLLF